MAGSNVMSGECEPVTDGGRAKTSGGVPAAFLRPGALVVAAYLVLGFAHMVVNATSQLADRRALGQAVDAWKPWVWEASSYLAWLALVPCIVSLSLRLSSVNRGWLVVCGHALLSVPVSLVHTALLFALRTLAYASVGQEYRFADTLAGVVVYEYRKDLITYISIVLVWVLLTVLLSRPLGKPLPQPAEIPRFEIREGSRKRWIGIDEIEWISAAGNYIELHGSFRNQLVRRTLSDVEGQLAGHGFVRVHRSRLVRKGAIESIVTRQSGDFDIKLQSGVLVLGSRRFRSGVT
jgi:LytTr DNA-binding domain